MSRYALILCFVTFSIVGNSQIAVGAWRDHFSFEKIISVYEMNDGRVVSAAQNGIIYIESDGSITKVTKTNGLYDVGISATEFFEDLNTVVIGYENGNIDIVNEDGVRNISDIKRKNISGDKNIYSITKSGNFAYLSCGFGIVKIDAKNAEVVDTYYIGPDASFVQVFKVAELGDTVYAATSIGLLVADKNTFLADYNNWQPIETNLYSNFKDIFVANNELFFIAKNDLGKVVLIKRKSDGTWKQMASILSSSARIFGKDKLYVPNYSEILVFNFYGSLEYKINELGSFTEISPNFVFINDNNELIVADNYKGIYVQQGNNFENYYYPGIYNNEAIEVNATDNFVAITRGGFTGTGTNLWNKGVINIFSNQQWTTIKNNDAIDYYSILHDPSLTGHFFVSSWGSGLFEYQNDQLLNHYDYTNSPLETIIQNSPYVRISGLDFDANNNLWILNRATNNPLNILKADGIWVSNSLNNLISNKETGDLKILQNNILWAIIKEQGFLALDYNNTIDNTSDDIKRVFYPHDEYGESIGAEVLCFKEDNDGAIWFGTDEGVGVIYSPQNFDDPNFYASRVKITANLNDSLTTNYLLKSEKILSIEIDGGNRKWFGTENSGVYLMNSAGTVELLHFTTENSPLPSNKIISISVEPKTGEVFFVTTKGVVSYRSNAIDASNIFENVYVFPNPVRPDYTGVITITGLAANVNVKITDVAANIVYETTANGGQATWDGNNFDGRRAATGIYLVFCSNNDGTETFVSKLLFIN
ncbi:MAG: hypothetical protein JXR68_01595 [Bacteroidales bacterium]|nr:hypothetical protein [Bacteroidales bacterium]